MIIGAFAALASYALFHLVTVFPLSWIRLYSNQSISEFLVVQIVGAGLAAVGIIASGLIADRYRPPPDAGHARSVDCGVQRFRALRCWAADDSARTSSSCSASACWVCPTARLPAR